MTTHNSYFNKSLTEVLKLLEEDSNKFSSWYELNWLKPNLCNYLLVYYCIDSLVLCILFYVVSIVGFY